MSTPNKFAVARLVAAAKAYMTKPTMPLLPGDLVIWKSPDLTLMNSPLPKAVSVVLEFLPSPVFAKTEVNVSNTLIPYDMRIMIVDKDGDISTQVVPSTHFRVATNEEIAAADNRDERTPCPGCGEIHDDAGITDKLRGLFGEGVQIIGHGDLSALLKKMRHGTDQDLDSIDRESLPEGLRTLYDLAIKLRGMRDKEERTH